MNTQERERLIIRYASLMHMTCHKSSSQGEKDNAMRIMEKIRIDITNSHGQDYLNSFLSEANAEKDGKRNKPKTNHNQSSSGRNPFEDLADFVARRQKEQRHAAYEREERYYRNQRRVNENSEIDNEGVFNTSEVTSRFVMGQPYKSYLDGMFYDVCKMSIPRLRLELNSLELEKRKAKSQYEDRFISTMCNVINNLIMLREKL